MAEQRSSKKGRTRPDEQQPAGERERKADHLANLIMPIGSPERNRGQQPLPLHPLPGQPECFHARAEIYSIDAAQERLPGTVTIDISAADQQPTAPASSVVAAAAIATPTATATATRDGDGNHTRIGKRSRSSSMQKKGASPESLMRNLLRDRTSRLQTAVLVQVACSLARSLARSALLSTLAASSRSCCAVPVRWPATLFTRDRRCERL